MDFGGSHRDYTIHYTYVDENLEPLGDWMIHPPYCEAGENVIEGNIRRFGVMEFFVTPFDLLVALEPDESVVSDLTAGEVIGLGCGRIR